MREPLAWTGASIVAGAAASPYLRADAAPCLLATALLALVALLGRRRRAAWLAIPAAGICLGLSAAGAVRAPPDLHGPTAISGRVVQASGAGVVVQTPRGRLSLRSDQPLAVGDAVAAWVSDAPTPAVLPGAWRGMAADRRAGVRPVRARALLRLGPAPDAHPTLDQARHAGLLRALAVGDRSGVDDDTRALLRRTGTAHLLAISGLHVGLLAGAVGGLAWVLTRPLALGRAWPLARVVPALASALAAAAYAVAVGSPASARRAAVMVAAAAGAVVLGRRPRPWTLLGLAAGALGLLAPGLVGDLGFQLSFSAVAGMLLVAPRILRWLPPDQPAWRRWLVGSIATTAGATAGTLPLTAWRFQELSVVSPLANLLVSPLVGSVTVPAALAAAWLPGGAGRLAAHLGDGSLDLVLGLLRRLDTPPLAPAVGPGGVLLLAMAVLLRRQAATAAGLAVLALGLRLAPANRLTLTFLAVGQGDATLVEWPDGRRWLVDGGPGGDAVLQYLRRRGIRRLDAIVLSHDHPDHSRGLLAVADALPFDQLWVSGPPAEPRGDAWALWRRAHAIGAEVRLPDDPAPSTGQPDGAQVEHPLQGWRARGHDAVNEGSLVLRLAHGAHSALLPGDVEEDAEALLALTLRPATVVKAPHHGSRSSSSAGLVTATRPALVIVPAGRDNSYGHPHAQALGRWRARSGAGRPCGADRPHADADCATRVLRTDQQGTIEWSTDGRTWRVRTWRADQGWRTLRPP